MNRIALLLGVGSLEARDEPAGLTLKCHGLPKAMCLGEGRNRKNSKAMQQLL
jgi:hypothetical protein